MHQPFVRQPPPPTSCIVVTRGLLILIWGMGEIWESLGNEDSQVPTRKERPLNGIRERKGNVHSRMDGAILRVSMNQYR